MKRLIASLLVAGLIVMPSGQAYAAFEVKSTAAVAVSGALTGGSTTFSVGLKKVSDDSACSAIDFTGSKTDLTIEGNCYASTTYDHDVVFDGNSDGIGDFKAILIFTNNRDASANPKYIGEGSGSGLVGKTARDIDAPLHWVVFDTKQAGGYTFTAYDPATTPIQHKGGRTKAEPIDTRNHLFVQDLRQDDATAFVVSDFDPGFATVIGGIAGKEAFLANAPVDATPSDLSDDNAPGTDGIVGTSDDATNKGPNRTVTDGDASVYLAVNYTGKPAQSYGTSTLEMGLATIT